jgi:hypothetical protein
MRRLLTTLLLLIAIGEAALILVFVERSQVSTMEVDRDRSHVQALISEAEAETAKYSGGAIKALIELRLAALKNTLTMLDQKRASWVRLIDLSYTIEGGRVREASDKELNDILGELSEAERAVASSKREAAQYTGGLIHSMSLMKAATEEVTVASLRMKFYFAKYGIPILLPSLESTKAIPSSPGKVVKDREAL